MSILKQHQPIKEMSPADLAKKYADKVRTGKTAKDRRKKDRSGTKAPS